MTQLRPAVSGDRQVSRTMRKNRREKEHRDDYICEVHIEATRFDPSTISASLLLLLLRSLGRL